MTPPVENSSVPTMDLVVGGTLAPTPGNLHRQQHLKPGPGLRLPSFEALGIAVPHPDRVQAASPGGILTETVADRTKREVDPNTAQRLWVEGMNAVQHSPVALEHPALLTRPANGACSLPLPISLDIVALTPTSEPGEPSWSTASGLSGAVSASMNPSADDPGPADVRNSAEIGQSSNEGATQSTSLAPAYSGSAANNLPSARSWIQGAAAVLLENIRTATRPSNPLKVLSHALPSPSPIGHIFSTLIESIHASTPSSPTVWINVFHAIPGRFNLSDLPTSPPSTPGPAVGGDDYFTQKVFDSAVSVSDYQDDLSSLPRSPRPVVPPGSVHVSIVERYIPPTSSREFSTMFNPSGPSILVDRLVELTPDNGCLVFIYPNKTGARTFMREYLSPVLDPLLRSAVVVNGLSSDLSRALGSMAAAELLPEHEQLERSMTKLCTTLTRPDSNIRRFQENRSTFSLVHASTQKVELTREAWARDWWTKQEKPKVREAMTRSVQEAQKMKSNEHVERAATATELVEQLLTGVISKPYPRSQEPVGGIEVSVFVIRRSMQ